MPRFNMESYLDSLMDKNIIEIIADMDREVSRVESISYSVRWAPRVREEGGPEYANTLKGYLFFLRTWTKPAWVDISPLKNICEKLVERSNLKPEILEYFN